MDKHCAVFREEAGLQQALETVQRLKEEYQGSRSTTTGRCSTRT